MLEAKWTVAGRRYFSSELQNELRVSVSQYTGPLVQLQDHDYRH
jgi:hypothetical protein